MSLYFPLIPRVQCLLHSSEDNKMGTTTLDDRVCGAAGLPSYRLEIPLRFYWVFIGYRTIDLESDPYHCFLGFLHYHMVLLANINLPHALRNIGPVSS